MITNDGHFFAYAQKKKCVSTLVIPAVGLLFVSGDLFVYRALIEKIHITCQWALKVLLDYSWFLQPHSCGEGYKELMVCLVLYLWIILFLTVHIKRGATTLHPFSSWIFPWSERCLLASLPWITQMPHVFLRKPHTSEIHSLRWAVIISRHSPLSREMEPGYSIWILIWVT